MSRNRLLSLIALITLSLPLAAQTEARAPAPAETALAARMQAFLAEVGDEPNTELVAFFPRRGDWTWMQTLLDVRSGVVQGAGVWRFAGAETVRAIGAGGPACMSFDRVRGEYGPFEGRLGMQALMHPGRWRRVRGNRFVPPDASPSSPVFVEWRREEGQWVVSAFGEEGIYTPAGLAPPRGPFSRDTTGVPEDAAFAPADWHTITVEGRRAPKYGTPRPIDRAALERIGVLHRVSVYVEQGSGPNGRGVVYLPVAPGQYQPYEAPLPMPCR
jgi:hypothetical protein